MKKTLKMLIACGVVSQLMPIVLLIYGAIRTARGSAADTTSLVGIIGIEAIVLALALSILLCGLLFYFACKERIKAAKILAPIYIGISTIALCILLFAV